MSPDHPLAPLLRELCPKRFPRGQEPELALDPIEIYELACALGARGVALRVPPGDLYDVVFAAAKDAHSIAPSPSVEWLRSFTEQLIARGAIDGLRLHVENTKLKAGLAQLEAEMATARRLTDVAKQQIEDLKNHLTEIMEQV